MPAPHPRLLLIATTTLVLAACDAFGSPIDGRHRSEDGVRPFEDASFPPPPPPPIIPSPPPAMCSTRVESVTERLPDRDTTDVPVSTAIVATFSEPVYESDDDVGIRLCPQHGGPFVDLECEAAGNAYRCQPVFPLNPHTRYRATIDAWALHYYCREFLELLPPMESAWTFTTAGAADELDAGVDDAGTDDAGGAEDFDCN